MRRGRQIGRHAVSADTVLDYGELGRIEVTSSGVRAVLWDTHSVTVRAKDQDRTLFPDTEARCIEHTFTDGTPSSGDYERFDLDGFGYLTVFIEGRLKVVLHENSEHGVDRTPLDDGNGHVTFHVIKAS